MGNYYIKELSCAGEFVSTSSEGQKNNVQQMQASLAESFFCLKQVSCSHLTQGPQNNSF